MKEQKGKPWRNDTYARIKTLASTNKAAGTYNINQLCLLQCSSEENRLMFFPKIEQADDNCTLNKFKPISTHPEPDFQLISKSCYCSPCYDVPQSALGNIRTHDTYFLRMTSYNLISFSLIFLDVKIKLAILSKCSSRIARYSNLRSL